MSVGRICCREVALAAPDERVLGAAQRMREARVGTLVVLSETRKPIGIVTDRDLVARVVVAGRDPSTTPVGRIMTANPKTIGEDSPIEAALAVMRAGVFRRLPVVDREGALVGILSLDDVLALLTEEFTHIGAILTRQAPPLPPERDARPRLAR